MQENLCQEVYLGQVTKGRPKTNDAGDNVADPSLYLMLNLFN